MLHSFMAVHVKAKDIPELCPPDADFPLASSPLTREQTFFTFGLDQTFKDRQISVPE